MREVSATQRPSTAWKVRFVINITFYLNKLLGARLIRDGRVDLPNYIRTNRFIDRMDKSNGREFEDKLCFFGFWPCVWTACVTWIILMRLVGGKGDADAGSRELRRVACNVFTSSLDVILVRR